MTPLFSEQIQLDEHVHDRPVGRLIEYCQHFQFIDEFIIPCSRHHARIIKLLIKEIISLKKKRSSSYDSCRNRSYLNGRS